MLIVASALLVPILCAPTLIANQVQYTISDFNVPGALDTQVGGINDADEIVGAYSNGTQQIGFTDIGGAITSITDGGQPTVFNGVASNGAIVGGIPNGAFLYSKGAFTPIAYPGASYISAVDVNSAGEVVGEVAVNGSLFGYSYNGGAYSSLGFVPSAINDNGDIVGISGVGTGYFQGVEDIGGVVTTFDYPGIGSPSEGYCDTELEGINNNGEILGSYHNCGYDGTSGLFLYQNGIVIPISITLGGTIDVMGSINDAREFGGFYAEGYAGFVAYPTGISNPPRSPAPEPGTLLLVGIGLVSGICYLRASESGRKTLPSR